LLFCRRVKCLNCFLQSISIYILWSISLFDVGHLKFHILERACYNIMICQCYTVTNYFEYSSPCLRLLYLLRYNKSNFHTTKKHRKSIMYERTTLLHKSIDTRWQNCSFHVKKPENSCFFLCVPTKNDVFI
jgi:hypothetical protein